MILMNSKFLIISFCLFVLSSCTTVERINNTISEKIKVLRPSQKETPDVAGKLVCAAAGIETDDCVEAVKTENGNEPLNETKPEEEEIIIEDISNESVDQDESLLK